MDAVPHDVRNGGGKQISGLTCPDCCGVLQVELIGPRDSLQFTCRIGHTYAALEALEAKEETLEERAWGAIVAAEELAALLRDLIRDGRVDAETARRFVARREATERLAHGFRSALENDRPLRVPASSKPLSDDEAPRNDRA